jgi:hypothetical protein
MIHGWVSVDCRAEQTVSDADVIMNGHIINTFWLLEEYCIPIRNNNNNKA